MSTNTSSVFNRIPAGALVGRIIPKFGEERVGKFTTLAFTLVACAGFGLFAINPTLSTIAELQKQLSDEQTVSQQLDTKIASIFSLQKAYPTIQTSLPLALQAIPDSPDTLGVAGLLQGLAKRDNISLTYLQIFPVEFSQSQNDKPLSFVFSMNVEGTYPSTILFMKDMTNLSRVITIDSLSFSSQPKGNFRATIKGRAYAQKSL